MKGFGSVLLGCKAFLQTPLTFENFTFSLWDIFLWTLVAGAVIWMITKWLGD